MTLNAPPPIYLLCDFSQFSFILFVSFYLFVLIFFEFIDFFLVLFLILFLPFTFTIESPFPPCFVILAFFPVLSFLSFRGYFVRLYLFIHALWHAAASSFATFPPIIHLFLG